MLASVTYCTFLFVFELLTAGIATIDFVIGVPLNVGIIQYLSKKPPDKRTALDLIVIDTLVVIIILIIFCFVFYTSSLFRIYLSTTFIAILTIWQYLVSNLFVSSCIITMVFKLLFINFSIYLFEFSDHYIRLMSMVLKLLFFALMFILDWLNESYQSNPLAFVVLTSGAGNGNDLESPVKKGIGVLFGMVTLFLLSLGTVIQIWNLDDHKSLDKSAIKFLAGCVSFTSSLLLVYLAALGSSEGIVIDLLIRSIPLITLSFISLVVPIVIIQRYGEMKKFFWSHSRYLRRDNRIYPIIE